MWRILKAEFRYNEKILVPSYFIITFMSMNPCSDNQKLKLMVV